LRTNGVEELVDIDLSLFPRPTSTRVRLFLDLAHNLDLQLPIATPSAVIGIPHGMTRNRPTLLGLPGLLEIFQTILGLLNDLLKDVDPVTAPTLFGGKPTAKASLMVTERPADR
jgi:hypothetical protein